MIGGRLLRADAARVPDPRRNAEQAYVVLFDPAGDSGFRPGASFSRLEVYEMLRSGVLTPGTRLRAGNRTYRVVVHTCRVGKTTYSQALATGRSLWVVSHYGKVLKAR